MAPAQASQLKRPLGSTGENTADAKKPRRSQRLGNIKDNVQNLPSPVTRIESTTTEEPDDPLTGTKTPPSQVEPSQGHSPEWDTQPYSQFVYPPEDSSYEVEDEVGQGVWGYVISTDPRFGDPLVLKRRSACPVPETKAFKSNGTKQVSKTTYEQEENEYEREKEESAPAGGYLIGRHHECDRMLDLNTISNRHCLIFSENKGGEAVAVLEDLSANGTYVNGTLIGRNKRRELEDGDEVVIVDQIRCLFRYPRSSKTTGFHSQYTLQERLGRGHFASVYLCVDKINGTRYAVKKFERRSGERARSQVDGLQQEIAILMGVSHPSLLCLKGTFDEEDGVYLVLELAPEGELFNWIVMKQRLTEDEARKVFVQLFQGVKYLHERGIVHRDIKPENILLTDKDLTVKLADFGLSKIIGEESFTTTLCGTPSYVAPEILRSSNYRRYTRAVDIWSLGVVLYICLCGFPPFSDELYSDENPYTLAEQILKGRFDYPSPYWDTVDDEALRLIDRMLTVDPEERITINECLTHPWLTGSGPKDVFQTSMDSTDGLTGRMKELDFSKRKPKRERTLLASMNEVRVTKIVQLGDDEGLPPVKVFEKNARPVVNGRKSEPRPADKKSVDEFARVGGQGDMEVFGNDPESRYVSEEAEKKAEKKAKKN